jgi:VCBS repeat-containing protein
MHCLPASRTLMTTALLLRRPSFLAAVMLRLRLVPHQLLMASILAGSYGTLTVGADGSYVYVVTNDNADIQALDESETITDTFTIQVSDGAGGTAEKTLEIEIQGTNDVPVAGARLRIVMLLKLVLLSTVLGCDG